MSAARSARGTSVRIGALGLGPIVGSGVRDLVRGAWRLARADGRSILTALAPFLLAQMLLAGTVAVNEFRAASAVIARYGVDPRAVMAVAPGDLPDGAFELYRAGLEAGTFPQIGLIIAGLFGTAASIIAVGRALRAIPYGELIEGGTANATARLFVQSLVGLAVFVAALVLYLLLAFGKAIGVAVDGGSVRAIIDAFNPAGALALTVVALIFGAWLAVRVGFAPYITALEGRGPLEGIRDAWRLTAGRTLAVLAGAWGSSILWVLLLALPATALFLATVAISDALGAAGAFIGAALAQGAGYVLTLPPLASILLLYEREIAVSAGAAPRRPSR